jgi:uncharacterized protein (UPF0332 family)
MFDAARGALLATNEVKDLSVIKTHTGLISQFSLHLVKTGRVSIEHGKALNKVEDLRLIADYTDNAISEQDSEWALTQANSFVEAMETLVRADRTT